MALARLLLAWAVACCIALQRAQGGGQPPIATAQQHNPLVGEEATLAFIRQARQMSAFKLGIGPGMHATAADVTPGAAPAPAPAQATATTPVSAEKEAATPSAPVARSATALHGASGSGRCLLHGFPEDAAPHAWMSDSATRRMALTNHGSRARLRAALHRHRREGSNLTLAFIGGSITAGQGAADGLAFPWWTEEIMRGVLGNKVRVQNGAVPGTLSSYMSVCHNMHVPKDSDIIFVEYAVNDDYSTLPVIDNPVRRPFERLLRKLLNYPKRPAVILVHSFVWHRGGVNQPPSGTFWPSSERDFHEFGVYYQLPEISVKAAAWRLMKNGVHGFMTDKTRGNHHGAKRPPEEDKDLKGRVYYWDVFHPDGNTGHKFMAEITAQALLDTLQSVDEDPLSEEERKQVAEDLPVPMIHNNWQSASDKCFIGLGFRNAVIEHAGWEYKDEGKDPGKPKLGYIAMEPGHTLKIKIDTMTASDKLDLPVTVEISYLKSYVHMGQAEISCVSGCTCEKSVVDGHNTEKNSQLHLYEWKTSQHHECIISIQVLNNSTSGSHKFKVAGIMISEEGGHEGIKNSGAVSMVMEGATKSADGTFDIRQWGRQDNGRVISGVTQEGTKA